MNDAYSFSKPIIFFDQRTKIISMDIYKYLAVLTQIKNLINKTKPIHLKKIMPDYQPSL